MIYLTGDTHIPIEQDVKKFRSREWVSKKKNLTKNDYLIVLGDFGLLWNPYNKTNYNIWLDYFNKQPYTTLWLDGNHENHGWINNLQVEEWNGGTVHKVSDSVIHLMRGQIYEIEKQSFFVCGGAWSIDKQYRTVGVSWWEEEEVSNKEMETCIENLQKHNNEVDYVLTHTCPEHVISDMFNPTVMYRSKTELFFNEIDKGLKYKKWYFGHWHKDVSYSDYVCLYHKFVKLGDSV